MEGGRRGDVAERLLRNGSHGCKRHGEGHNGHRHEGECGGIMHHERRRAGESRVG